MTATKLTAKQKQYNRAFSTAASWASTVDISELRRGNADRVARSYGIEPKDALIIITNAYRERNRDGKPATLD